MTFEELLRAEQYSLPQADKESILLEQLNTLTEHHRAACPSYERLVRVLQPCYHPPDTLAAIPYFPVSLFKTHILQSIPDADKFKILTSSGTTGQQVSRIVLDRDTARRQTAALSRIITHVLGPDRLPMIIIDSADVVANRSSFSARAAGVAGMMNFGRNHFYALDGDMRLNERGLADFLERFSGRDILIFGFTFMVWQYFLAQIQNSGIDLSRAILFHSGGWKKLQDLSVTNDEFRRHFHHTTGLSRIYNFYGMVEQVGSIFLEGEDGYLYAPNYADIIIRNPLTWREAAIGETGVIQVLSILPVSYPGHSLLTEDLGVVMGIDNSTCGRKGKYFRVLGRLPKAELRGCSDTHAFGRVVQ